MSDNQILPLFKLSGTSYEIGFQHGEQCKPQIMKTIDCYRSLFKDFANMEWERAKELSRNFIDIISAYNADYLEEIRGVADGAGLDFEDILALNCRSELAFAGAYLDDMFRREGCTSIGVNSDAGLHGDSWLAQNWDWRLVQRQAVVQLQITQTNGKPRIHMLTEAGIIGKLGLNSYGVATTLNAISTNAAPNGVPLHLILRGMLDSNSLTAAMIAAVRSPIGCCANIMTGSRCCEVVDLEIENEDFDVLYPKDGILLHTNHFLSPRLPRAPRKDQGKYTAPTSFVRLGMAERLIKPHAGQIDQTVIGNVLKSHFEFPAGICGHEDPTLQPIYRMGTVFSMIINLSQRRLWLAKGFPCDTPYEEVDLSFFDEA